MVHRLVMNLCVAWNGLPSRVPMAITSTIQLAPYQFALMCSGASLARRVQVMLRPWLFSCSVATPGILLFPWNWLWIWRWSVFRLALTVSRKSVPCSVNCRITVAGCGAHPPESAHRSDPAPRGAS